MPTEIESEIYQLRNIALNMLIVVTQMLEKLVEFAIETNICKVQFFFAFVQQFFTEQENSQLVYEHLAIIDVQLV